jgi:cytochrome o ubiquinol oxidase subunit IV
MASANPQGHVTTAGESHGSLRSYVTGFVISVILTAGAFFVVMHPTLPHVTIVATILVLAVVQIVVHLVFFLHLDNSSAQRWNVTAFAFALMVVLILILGSLWIMHNVSDHMTGNDISPAMAQQS